MKTTYILSEIEKNLESRMTIVPGSVEKLTEGHSSQVFAFASKDKRLVILIREDGQDLLADKYAYEHFNNGLPIPKIFEVECYDDKSFYTLESENLPERKAVCWAINSLRDITFAATQSNEQVAKRLHRDIKQKILI